MNKLLDNKVTPTITQRSSVNIIRNQFPRKLELCRDNSMVSLCKLSDKGLYDN
jgi:hypothetical protein